MAIPNMARLVQEKIKRPLADELLFGQLSQGGGHVRVTLKDEDIHLEMDSAAEAVKS